MTTHLCAKTFIGILLTAEFRIQLSKSALWKQAQFESPLKEIQSNGKSFLGFFIQEEIIAVEKLKKLEEEIRSHLSLYCPVEKIPIHIFSQIFIE